MTASRQKLKLDGIAIAMPSKTAAIVKRQWKSVSPRLEAKVKARWIETFAAHGWRLACEEALCDPMRAWRWITHDSQHRSDYIEARLARARVLEAQVDDIACGIVDCGMTRLNALTLLLRGCDPSLYSRTALELTGKDGGAIEVKNGDASRGAQLLSKWVKAQHDEPLQLVAQ